MLNILYKNGYRIMEIIKPKALKQGDTIGVIAPSSHISKEDIEQATGFFESKGFKTKIHPQVFAVDEQFAGTVDQKIDAIHDVFLDKDIDAVFCARGGNGAIHLIDKIDYDLIRQNPKIFMGYSDDTMLHHAFNKKSGLATFYGPMFREFSSDLADPIKEFTLSFLSGNFESNLFDYGQNLNPLKSGECSGPLYGGTLLCFSGIMMSPDYLPDFEGSILVLEDVNEELSQIDRTLGALRLSGLFDKISGLIFGTTELKTDGGGTTFGRSLEQVIRENTAGLDIPIVMNAPFGHEQPNIVFPIGVKAKLVAGDKSSLTLLESPFIS